MSPSVPIPKHHPKHNISNPEATGAKRFFGGGSGKLDSSAPFYETSAAVCFVGYCAYATLSQTSL